MITKIIFISMAKTTKSMIERFYLDILYAQGIDVEYWDIRGIYFDENDQSEFPFVKKVTTFIELKKEFAKLDSSTTLINLQLNYALKFWKLFYMTNSYQTSFFSIGYFPQYIVTSNKYFMKLKKLFSIRLITKFLELLIKKLFIKDIDIVFYAGSAAKEGIRSKKQYPINYIDYEKQMEIKESINDGSYCVFIDLNLHSHPDLKEIGLNYVDKNNYFSQLKELFEYVESAFDIDVLIALHPTSNILDFWPSEKQFKSKTDELIQKCDFVMSHYSTSLFAAVSSYKPIILLYNQDIINEIPHAMGVINGFEQDLNIVKINMDNENKITNIPTVNRKLYKDLLYKYCISMETEHKKAESYLVHYINEISKETL